MPTEIHRVTLYCEQNKYAEYTLALNKEVYSHYSACRANQALLIKLVPDNTTPLGPTIGPGVSATTNVGTYQSKEHCLRSFL